MRVALVTTWDTPCGIAEFGAYLKASVEAADREIEITPITDLHPRAIPRRDEGGAYDLVVLNYQAALLSQWTPEMIHWAHNYAAPTLVIYHDTGVPNSDQCKAVCAAADAFVVHEPYDDLEGNGRYWRMGVPGWQGEVAFPRGWDQWHNDRPILGTVGFPFPWKNYDELARVTAEVGWALYLIAPTATADDARRWVDLNPHLLIENGFLGRTQVVQTLAACDATAFCYTCANTGQSGAMLQGIAARKSVIAFRTCRQMRSLWEDPLASQAIRWCETFDHVTWQLRNLAIERVCPPIVALAEQDSWVGLGQKYAQLFRELVA